MSQLRDDVIGDDTPRAGPGLPETGRVLSEFVCKLRVVNCEPPRVAIRPEMPEDQNGIRHVVAAAFGSDAEADLVDRIRASPEYVAEMALVAEAEGELVGHVMVSNAMLRNSDGERSISMLAPLAVRPDLQKRGIGGSLVKAVLKIANDRREPAVILEGSPAYYQRFGFEHSVLYGIEIHLPDWAPAEAAQVKRLATFDPNDTTLRGNVIYPSAFDGLE